MNVGFIGVGSMGAAMVTRLVNAGHRVQVWNRDPEAVRELTGVTVLSAVAQAFSNDVVITMLADDRAVRDVIMNGLVLRDASKDCVHVMMATISPVLTEELARLHHDAGIAYVAAPVFGVPAVAALGQLNIVASGNAQATSKVQPLFDAMGQKTWYLGDDPKHANIAKIAGNMMIAQAIEAMAEATALTESYGLQASDFLNIITNTLFSSPSYKRYGGFIAENNYDTGFKLSLGLKDIKLALDSAQARQVTLPAADIVSGHMQQAMDQGWAEKDWSVFTKIIHGRSKSMRE